MDEQITVKSIVGGDKQAAEKLIRDYYDGIHRLARHLTRNDDDAADLAQATFIKAYAKLDRFDGRSSIRAWLAGILYNEFLHWNRGKRFVARLLDTWSFDPTKQILDREILLQAIHQLPAKLRDAFLLVEVHGFEQTEASLTLNVPLGTVKSRLFAARSQLRQSLEPNSNKEVSHEI